MERHETTLPTVAVAQKQLDFELSVLRALKQHGVTSVAEFPPGGVAVVKPNPQDNGVRLKLNGRKLDQRFNANISDKVTAARALKERMKGEEFVGEAAVLAAEQQVRLGTVGESTEPAPAELTDAEALWLCNWYDEQPEPDQVTLEQADGALATHRVSSGCTSVTQVLFETQWLHAKLRSAQLRFDKAARGLERAKAALPERHEDKRPRPTVPDHPRIARGGTNPPNWDRYHSYSQSTYQKLEVEEQDRCAVLIDRNRLDRSLPPGDELRGWHNHWRRGIYTKLRGWAAGSLGAIVFMLAACAREFDVVDELADELGLARKGDVRKAAVRE